MRFLTKMLARAALKHMKKGASIIATSSETSIFGSAKLPDYSSTKGAINALTKTLAQSLVKKGIRVNAVRPGVIYTEMHASGGEPNRVDRVKGSVPMLRGGRPEEVAEAILWLLSEQASYVTGTVLDVAGGR